jgi:hypothetical protein
MADAVATQVLVDNASRLVLKFTNISDGTGESAVGKVIPDSYGCSGVTINRIYASTAGMGVDILWAADANVLCWHVPADTDYDMDFSAFGLANNAGAGKTGVVRFTTVGHSNGDRYSIILDMRKVP